MGMEGVSTEELSLCNNDATHIAKGKRTKRLRLLSPCGVAVVTSSCSSASADGGGGDYGSFSSSTTNQEEEDMANCLILLAQGKGDSQELKIEDHDHDEGDHKIAKSGGSSTISTRKISDMVTTTTNTAAAAAKIGFYVYECKTCNRTFPSFQALGGHRASHKRPKIIAEEKKPSPPPPPTLPPQQIGGNFDHFQEAHIKTGPQFSLQLGHKANFSGTIKPKIHECSICGSEFSSGQALGGHMRRHRTSSTNTTACEVTAATTAVKVEVPPRNILELDLNLPAPEEEPKFQFTPTTQKSMVLSAVPALVDCHY